MKVTAPMRRGLAELVGARDGHVDKLWPKGFAKASWNRMMDRLCALGLARPYLHGGYQITGAGRDMHHLHVVDAEARSGVALGNANEARERGDDRRTEHWDKIAQKWLDEANELRRCGEGKL